MKINCAPELTITKADEVGSGWFIPPVWVSALYMKTLKPLKSTVIAQEIQLLPVLRQRHVWGTFLTSLTSSQERFNPPWACYYLSPQDAAHTSPTTGVQVSVPSLAERSSTIAVHPEPADLNQSQLSPAISWSAPSREGDPELGSVSLQPRQVWARCRLRDQPPAKATWTQEGERMKGELCSEICLFDRARDVHTATKTTHTPPGCGSGTPQPDAGMSRKSGHGDCCCWHWVISLNEAVKEWRGRGRGGGRHFHTSDNSWPVPRQEEWRLIRARAIELRPEPIQLGVQHGEASVFKLLLQLSCQRWKWQMQKREYLDTARRLWGMRLAYVFFRTRIGGCALKSAFPSWSRDL